MPRNPDATVRLTDETVTELAAAIAAETDENDATRIRDTAGDFVEVNDDGSLPVRDSVHATDNEFWRIKNKRLLDSEEVRYDIAAELANGDIYTGVAPDGTATSAASWTVIRTYFDANGNPNRERIRTSVVWDDRTAGW